MNKVVHFEIPFDDKQRAMRFYGDMFGWKLVDMPQMNYVLASSVEVDEQQMPKEPGAINGGLFQRPKDAPHPTIYVAVESVDGTIRKVEAAGGTIELIEPPKPQE